jgi:AraC family transcriptional regulator of adaptative response / DNA-3-methyladenine glycosylase II
MLLEPDLLYRALQSRDRRFEGSFIAAITTTGVYCRPGCPARMPRPENVRFFACGAAAEEAGFRACLRCRPDRSVLLPAAAGTSATVTRALQLFSQGAADQGLLALCDRLGVGQRHLRRLFLRHLGTSPQAVLRSQRLHSARALIEESDLPMAELALAAGYGSVRRFNAEVKRTFRRTPLELRTRARSGSRALGDGAPLTLEVRYQEPLEWEPLLAFFASRAIDGVEHVHGGTYARTVLLEGEKGPQPTWLSVIRVPGRPALRVSCGLFAPRAALALAAGVRRMFGCQAQPGRASAQLQQDPLLGPVLRSRPGLRVPGAWDPFELSVRALLGQQVSVRGAATLAARLVAQLGEPLLGPQLPAADGLARLFPTPRAMAEAGPARLQALGLTSARARALHGLADAVASERLRFDRLAARGLDDAVAELCALDGFGPWTAHYVALRALGEPDAFPPGDLGLLRALRREQPEATARDLQQRAEGWRPFRATAAIALWLADPGPAPRAAGRSARRTTHSTEGDER